jgi:Helix-turn-helix.
VAQESEMRVISIGDAAAAVRGHRLDLDLSQDQLARRAGMSRKWVYEFEAGKPKAEFAHVLRVFEALGLHLDLSKEGAHDEPASAIDLDALLDEHRRG